MKITKKYYNKRKRKFYIERTCNDGHILTNEYDSFINFYKGVKGDLGFADLIDYDFDGVNLSRFNFDGARLSSEIRKKLNIYDCDFYVQLEQNACDEKALRVKEISLDKKSICEHNKCIYNDKNLCVCYISDLHLDMKILNKYPNAVNTDEIYRYFQKKVLALKDTIPQNSTLQYWNNINYRRVKIIIMGDVSCNFDVFKTFFTVYREHIDNQTFFILGNHELWDKNLICECGSLEKMVDKYRSFLASVDITLLENQLYLSDNEQHILSDEEIISMDEQSLANIINCNRFVIFGGIGFSGLNNIFNWNNGIYRSAPLDRDSEIMLSKRVDCIYRKLSNVSMDYRIIWATHMPKEDYTIAPYNKNWVYLSGHTHKNTFEDSDSKHIYADNQVGYKRMSFGFKQFWISPFEDMFESKEDGIYEITAEQYRYFYRAIEKSIDFYRQYHKIYMVKKSGMYCFLMQKKEGGDIKILAGGNVRNTGRTDIKYFYDNLDNYTLSLNKYLHKYSEYQEKVAQNIRAFGGYGTIHGCIVDIDDTSHIYVNPIDAKLTPYWARSITYKHVYKNVASLLAYHRSDLYNNILQCNANVDNSLVKIDDPISCDNDFVSDTSIYRLSKVIYNLQFVARDNVVRVWFDDLLNEPSEQKGKAIVEQLVQLPEYNVDSIE